MKKLYAVFFACLCISFTNLFSQNTFPSNGSVGIGTTAPNASSILEIKSTSKGVLVPRMTMAQRNAIPSPAQSLIVFQTDSPSGFYYYDGGWKSMSALGYFATTKLDNLDVNTAISQTLLPNSNNAKDLGSSSYGWRNLYVNGIGYLTAAQLGNYTGTPQAGMLRWTGTAFQGYNGSSWITLSGASAYVAGTGISISGTTISNTAPDQTVKLSGTGSTTVSGTYPNFSINSTDNDKQNLSVSGSNLSISNGNTVAIPQAIYTAGSGINITGTTITNTAPDQMVTLTGNGATTVTGTYPNFTVSSIDNNTTYTAGAGINIDENNNIVNTAPSQWVTTDNNAFYNNGNVGIGTSAPGYTLDVNGNINLSGSLVMGGTPIFNYSTAGSLFIGEYAGSPNNSGESNTAIGVGTFNKNTSGTYNTAAGAYSLVDNTTGNYNTASGAYNLHENTTGSYNVADGYRALFYNTVGNNNIAFGYEAIYDNPQGSNNVGIGYQSLFYALGSNNTALGYTADIGGYCYNTTAIGNEALGTDDNQVRIGNSSVTSIGGYTDWTNISDGRVKKNIKENIPGLIFINKLNPVTYNLDLDAADKIIQHLARKDKDGKSILPSADEVAAKEAKEKILYTGFIAQDVEKAAKTLDYDFSGVDIPRNDKSLYGLRYSEFVVPLVKAVQELSVKNDSLQNQNKSQQTEIDNLQSQINQLRSILTTSSPVSVKSQKPTNQTIELGMNATLSQNIPNPFNGITTINYFLPLNNANAYICFTNSTGQVLKQQKLSGSGIGTINLKANELPSGVYQYSLIVDGKRIDTKQMVLMR